MFGFFKKRAQPKPLNQQNDQIELGPVLQILDACANKFTFPMLDNGYKYLAASRLTAFHGESGWALVFEIFDFSPRAGFPALSIQTFASTPVNRKGPSEYVSFEAWQQYVNNNPHNEYKSFYSIENEDWLDEENYQYVKPNGHIILRGQLVDLPNISEYASSGIELEEDRPLTFEFCRFLAAHYHEQLLGTEAERRHNVADDLKPVLVLDDWIHIDLADAEMPSQSETFKQLEQVLLTGDSSHYTLAGKGNTHWSNWPEGGTL